MKVLLAPDKFKGSLTAAQVATHLGCGLAERGIAFHRLPLADGGDGSVAAAVHAGFAAFTVTGPTGLPRTTEIAYDGYTVEVADACGLAALADAVLAPMTSSSRGLGDAMREAVHRGARRLVMALGGSASIDGGAGMLAALGVRFLDGAGDPVDVTGGTLRSVRDVDCTLLLDLAGVEVVGASDVQNPLTGPLGGAATYGPQKHASPSDIQLLDSGLANLVNCLSSAGYSTAHALSRTPGAGSAGGIGFAGLILGAEFFLDLLDFDRHLRDCDLVITGEGRMDAQTLQGKLPAVIARRADSIPVIAVVGRSDITPTERSALKIVDVFPLTARTDRNLAYDPELSAQLLVDIGRSLPLDHYVTACRG